MVVAQVVTEKELITIKKRNSMKCPKCNSKDIVEGFSFTEKGEPDLESFICDECGNEWNK